MPAARMNRAAPRAVLACMVSIAICAATGTSAAAPTAWVVHAQAASHGQGKAQPVPSAPVASATCSLVSLQITVSWTAVPHASSYTIYQSTTGAAGSYSAVASGVAGTSWTSGILLLGTYFYKVTATVGTTWVSALSAATAGHTITVLVCT